MYPKLKYLYYPAIFAACLASSCTSDTPDNEEVRKGTEMSFAVSGLTRASETESFNEFAVYGDMKFAADDEAAPLVIFNKTVVEHINNKWTYEGTQYWYPDHEHSFVAIHPLSVLEPDNDPQYSNSQLSFTYIIPTSEDNKVTSHTDISDILVATHRRLFTDKDSNTTTTFTFGHVMSKINIAPALDDNIMSEDEYIVIKKIELSGFKTEAQFNILPASRQTNNQTDDRVINVNEIDQEGNGNLTLTLPKQIEVLNNRENVKILDDDNCIIMIPQAFAADSDAKIIISYTINNETTMHHIALSLAGKQWEIGKSYTYKFTFSRRGLHSESTSITDWDPMNVGNINAH